MRRKKCFLKDDGRGGSWRQRSVSLHKNRRWGVKVLHSCFVLSFKGAIQTWDQGLTSTRYPTRPNFSKFPSIGFFPAGYFPAGRFKSSNNNPQILLFSSPLDMKSSVSKVKCLRYKKWIQEKSGKFDLFQWRQSNPRFIHLAAIKSINQDGDKLLSDEAHAL